MNRFHVHLHVKDLEQSLRFYSTLFGKEPLRVESGHAKWMLEDPRVNFAISTGQPTGVSHLGFQVETDAELSVLDETFRDEVPIAAATGCGCSTLSKPAAASVCCA